MAGPANSLTAVAAAGRDARPSGSLSCPPLNATTLATFRCSDLSECEYSYRVGGDLDEDHTSSGDDELLATFLLQCEQTWIVAEALKALEDAPD